MSFNVEKLRKAMQENDEGKGAEALGRLPKWARPKPGASTALFVPKRRKAGGERGKTPAKEGEEAG